MALHLAEPVNQVGGETAETDDMVAAIQPFDIDDGGRLSGDLCKKPRGPMDRFLFLANVDRVLDTNPPVSYVRTAKAQKEVRLVLVYRGAACNCFTPTGSRGQWQVIRGYGNEFLDPPIGSPLAAIAHG